MSKVKYKYNTQTLTYEKVQLSWWNRIRKFLGYLATGTVFAAVTVTIAFAYFDSPKEKQLKREIENMQFQYEVLNGKLTHVNEVLAEMQFRDDNIYRTILEAEPIPENLRQAGSGGVNRYRELEGYDNSRLIIETSKKIDRISKQLYIQSKSFDEVVKLAKNKNQLLASIPAIQPIANKDLRHQPSGYGWRTHPIYKTSEFHAGMDFAANTGTEIYATGDGVVERADDMAQGYGNHVVIDHGFGYKTLYGHMSKMSVTVGQKVKRGQVIGYVGSTGLSTAPHVHYEVLKNGERINPINFFYNDLSPAEYEELVRQASRATQSFD
jgi:murein DD-endopeptidase MepM/ murein hydrolase activator NlpD